MYPFQNQGHINQPQYRYPSVDRIEFPPIQFGINNPPFVPQLQLDPQLMSYLGLVAYCCAKHIQDSATVDNASPIRIYMYNITADNRFMNQEFTDLVFDAARFVNYLLYVARQCGTYEEACEVAAQRMCAYRAANRYYNDTFLQQALKDRLSNEDIERYRNLKQSYDNSQQQFMAMQMTLNQPQQPMYPQQQQMMYPNQMPMQGYPQQGMYPNQAMYPQQQMSVQGYPQQQMMYPGQVPMQGYPQQGMYPQQMAQQPFQQATRPYMAPQPPVQQFNPMYQPQPGMPGIKQDRPWGRDYGNDDRTEYSPVAHRPDVQETKVYEPNKAEAEVNKLYPLDTDLLTWKPSVKQRFKVLHNPLTHDAWLQKQEDGTVLMVMTEKPMDYDKHKTAKIERYEQMVRELQEAKPKEVEAIPKHSHDKESITIDFKTEEDLKPSDIVGVKDIIRGKDSSEVINQSKALVSVYREKKELPNVLKMKTSIQTIFRSMGPDAFKVIEAVRGSTTPKDLINLLRSSQVKGRSTETFGNVLDGILCEVIKDIMENNFGIKGFYITKASEDWDEFESIMINKYDEDFHQEFIIAMMREFRSRTSLANAKDYFDHLKEEDPFGIADHENLMKDGDLGDKEEVLKWASDAGLIVFERPMSVYKLNCSTKDALAEHVRDAPYAIFKSTNSYLYALSNQMDNEISPISYTMQLGALLFNDSDNPYFINRSGLDDSSYLISVK